MTIKKSCEVQNAGECRSFVLPVRDALEVLNGKWKLPIIISLSFGNKRFKEMARELEGITDKTLSKALKELESHQLIKRTVYDSFPPMVEYSLEQHGKTLHKVIDELYEWGLMHRKKNIKG